jgi:hypothetical protein
MTLDEFFEALQNTPRDWYLANNCIRRGPDERYKRHCPISTLMNRDAGAPFQCAEELGLSRSDAWAVIDAADGWGSFNPELRTKLMKACGL